MVPAVVWPFIASFTPIISIISFITIICLLIIHWNIQPYYKKYSYIAHALGGIDNQDYTNSKEALEYSYSMGYKYLIILS